MHFVTGFKTKHALVALVAILKPGKDALEPSSYRLIGLESCLLMMVTFITERRMVTWMEDLQLLPDTREWHSATGGPHSTL